MTQVNPNPVPSRGNARSISLRAGYRKHRPGCCPKLLFCRENNGIWKTRIKFFTFAILKPVKFMKLKIFFLLLIAMYSVSCTKQKNVHFTIQSQQWVPTPSGDQWIISKVINDGDMPSAHLDLTIFATDTQGQFIQSANASFSNEVIQPGQTVIDTVVFSGLPMRECNFTNSLTW